MKTNKRFPLKNMIAALAVVVFALPLTVNAAMHADYDNDGKIGTHDALYLMHHQENPDLYPVNQPTDLNGDGTFDREDILTLLRHTLDSEKYPLEERHVEEIIPGKAPACTEEGMTDGIRCSVCETILQEQQPIPAGHNFSRWFEIEPGGCSLEPYHIRFCMACGYFESDLDSNILHPHKWILENKEPTCTEDGYENYYHCVNCDKVLNKTVLPALGHDMEKEWHKNDTYHYLTCTRCIFGIYQDHTWQDWIIDQAETCTVSGERHRECSVCHHAEYQTIPASHELTHREEKAPTCTEPGHPQYRFCSRCSYTTFRELPALGHQVISGEYQTDETYHWLFCTRCSHTEGKEKHLFSEWKILQDITCTQDFMAERTCTACGYTETSTIPASGHSIKNQWFFDDNNHWSECNQCEDQLFVSPHTCDEWSVSVPANCENSGAENGLCSTCFCQLAREISPLGHRWEKDYNSTHHYEKCSREDCGGIRNEEPHDMGAWNEIEKSTCTKEGLERRSCKGCKYSEERSTPITEHCCGDWVYDESKHWKVCGECGQNVYADTHTFSEWILSYPSTCTTVGEQYQYCTCCGFKVTAPLPVLDHVYSSWMSNGRNHWKECLSCGHIAFETSHTFGEWSETVAPTCAEKGAKQCVCLICEYTETDPIPELGHIDSEWIRDELRHYKYCSRCRVYYSFEFHDWSEPVSVDATCEVGGHKLKSCLTCNYTMRFDEGKPLDHLWYQEYSSTHHYEICTRVINGSVCAAVRNLEPHDIGDWVEYEKATCTKEGTEIRGCGGCDYYEKRSTPTLEHSYGSWLTDKDNHWKQCVNCGNLAHTGSHTFGEWIERSPYTCTYLGEKYRTCTCCEYEETAPILEKMLGHLPSDGYEKNNLFHWKVCVRDGCNARIQPITAHENKWVIDTEPTCTTPGSKHQECTVCGYASESKPISVVDHNHSGEWLSDSTHHYRICANIGCNAEIDRTPHNNGDNWFIDTEPTCTTPGSKHQECTVCEHNSEPVSIPAIDHDHSGEWVQGTDTHYRICARPECNAVLDKTVHNHNSFHKDADYHWYSCTTCGKTQLNMEKHIPGEWETVTPATCTEEGLQKQYCINVRCHHEFSATNILPKLSHDKYDDLIKNETHENGVTTYKHIGVIRCRNCNYLEEVGIFWVHIHNDVEVIEGTPATCTEPGLTVGFRCTADGCREQKQEEIPPLGHDYVDGICTRCGHVYPYSWGLMFELSNDGTYYSVTGVGSCTDTDLRIPDTYNGKPVKEIGWPAFNVNFNSTNHLTSVIIPDSVVSICVGAFNKCKNLESVVIGKNVTTIGDNAFSYCSVLREINIPDSVTSIGEQAFYGCTSLESITIGENVTNIGTEAFANCSVLHTVNLNAVPVDFLSNNHRIFASSGLEGPGITVKFGENVTKVPEYMFLNDSNCNVNVVKVIFADNSKCESIGFSAFQGCYTLTDITLPPNLKEIGGYAFYNTGLQHVVLPDSVTIIDDYAFKNCTKLECVTIGKNLSCVGLGVFQNCSVLNTVNFNAIEAKVDGNIPSMFGNSGTEESGITVNIGADVVKIPDYMFSTMQFTEKDTTNIVNVTFASGSKCEIIGNGAFANCKKLTNIILPPSLKEIGEMAFIRTALREIIIPDSVTTIGSFSFSSTGLQHVVIPDSVTMIHSGAFQDCTKLESVTIGRNVTKIEGGAFSGCPILNTVNFNAVAINDVVGLFSGSGFEGCGITVNISADIVKIPDFLFARVISAPNITKIVFADGSKCESIGSYAFDGCEFLTELTLPPRLRVIEEYAFFSCSALREIVIPDSVTSIGADAFYKCTNLKSITLGQNVISIGNGAFSGCSALRDLVIPDSVTSIGAYAFYNCTNLKSITIGKNVSYIGSNSFVDSNSLQSVFYKGTASQWSTLDVLFPSSGGYTTVYFYAASRPASNASKYWRYVNGVPTVWN